MSRSEHATFMAMVEGAEQAGHSIPCRQDAFPPSATWTSSNSQEQRAAAYACQACPLILQCHTYATTSKEPAGVWAGLTESDRAARRGRPPKSTAKDNNS